MVERLITLTLKPAEERALASLVAWACNNFESDGPDGYGHLHTLMEAAGVGHIGALNACLNANR